MLGIFGWRTDSFCGGISLKTGAIAIIVFRLVSGVCIICKHYYMSCSVISAISIWIGEFIFIAIELAALYGIFNNKPDFLIPHLVVTVIHLITFLLVIIGLIILFPFAAKLSGSVTYETPDGKVENVGGVTKEKFYVLYALVILLFIIIEAIHFYCFIVVLSYYEYMRTNLSTINPPPKNSNFVA